MSSPRLVLAVVSCAGAALLGCDRKEPRRSVDSTVDSARTAPVAKRRATDWASELGVVLVVPADSDNAAVVLYPDEPSAQLLASAPTTLVTITGDTARVRLALADSQQCDAAVVRLTGEAPASWSVGMLGRSGALLRMDSIETLPAADSARLAADLARLASALTMHKNSRFTGLPFAVLAAHRFASDSMEFLVGHLVRRLNQEASPLEERTLILAERPRSPQGAAYKVTYSQRSEGSEETAAHFEALGAFRGRHATLLVIVRDQPSATTYEVLERSSGGTWRTRWSRSLAC